mmetsp:Transcript_46853/g.54299  ORF Transcript_46853/g.54299 Transcript_46853/m.54299 type:complete len:112 (+) Transcript_46853:31-366(+)
MEQQQGQSMENQQRKMAEQQEQMARAQEMRETMLKAYLDNDARERLARIKLVKPEKAQQLESHVIKLGQSGQLQEPLTEPQLVSILEKISDSKTETKITFVRKRADSDDDW